MTRYPAAIVFEDKTMKIFSAVSPKMARKTAFEILNLRREQDFTKAGGKNICFGFRINEGEPEETVKACSIFPFRDKMAKLRRKLKRAERKAMREQIQNREVCERNVRRDVGRRQHDVRWPLAAAA